MATTQERTLIAAELWNARQNRSSIEPPSSRVIGFDLEDGYAVGAELYARRVALGERRAGLKIGFTNTSVWTTLGLAEPICAVVYDGSVRYASDVAGEIVVDTRPLVAPAIEPEIVVGIDNDGLSWWALGFEIVHCHYPDWKLKPADAIADCGLHAELIVGTKMALRSGAQALDSPFGIELFRNGVSYERGTTAAVLGGPLLALERAKEIVAREAALEPLRAGDVVTTGSITSAPRVTAGETWTVRADNGAPSLEIVFR